MLITNSKDGVIVDLNHAFTNFTGFKLKDIVGKSTLEMDYITLEERAKVVSEINVNGCSENNKKEIRDKNNKIKSIIFNTFPIAEDTDSLLITYLFDMSKARLRIELHNDVLFKVLTAITGVGIILIKDYEGTKSVFYENNEARQILKGNSIKNIFNVLIEKKVLYLNVKSELYCAKIFSIHNDSCIKLILLEKLLSNKFIQDEIVEFDLTPRQQEVAFWVAMGLTNKEISEKLCIADNTVKDHIKDIFQKLGVHSRCKLFPKIFDLQ
jgi:DNA-binding CsgD family transcriptional regulator